MDLRIAKTKSRLTAALSVLAAQKPIDKITVSELCKEANVNRTTFYKYYMTPRDIVQESLNQLMNDLLKHIQADRESKAPVDPYPTILHGCKLFHDDKALNSDLLNDMTPVMEVLQTFFHNVKELTEDDIRLLMFISGGCVSYLRYWFMIEPERTPEEAAEGLTKFVLKYYQDIR